MAKDDIKIWDRKNKRWIYKDELSSRSKRKPAGKKDDAPVDYSETDRKMMRNLHNQLNNADNEKNEKRIKARIKALEKMSK